MRRLSCCAARLMIAVEKGHQIAPRLGFVKRGKLVSVSLDEAFDKVPGVCAHCAERVGHKKLECPSRSLTHLAAFLLARPLGPSGMLPPYLLLQLSLTLLTIRMSMQDGLQSSRAGFFRQSSFFLHSLQMKLCFLTGDGGDHSVRRNICFSVSLRQMSYSLSCLP